MLLAKPSEWDFSILQWGEKQQRLENHQMMISYGYPSSNFGDLELTPGLMVPHPCSWATYVGWYSHGEDQFQKK